MITLQSRSGKRSPRRSISFFPVKKWKTRKIIAQKKCVVRSSAQNVGYSAPDAVKYVVSCVATAPVLKLYRPSTMEISEKTIRTASNGTDSACNTLNRALHANILRQAVVSGDSAPIPVPPWSKTNSFSGRFTM